MLRRSSNLVASAITATYESSSISSPYIPSYSSQQRLDYHSTPQIDFPARRRRRPSPHRNPNGRTQDESTSSSDETKFDSPLKHDAVDDNEKFLKAATDLLTKVEMALEPMKSKNETFILNRSEGDIGEILTLDLGPTLGNYSIEISNDEHCFEYSSPISGKLLYVLSSQTGDWVGQNDGHSFEGLLVRDLIRYCNGMPNF